MNRSFDDLAQFLPSVLLLRIGAPRFIPPWNKLLFELFRDPTRIVGGDEVLARLALLQRIIDGNAGQPSRNPRLLTKLAEVAKGLQESILHRFLGILDISQDSQRDAEYAAFVFPNQRLKGLAISSKDPMN